MLFNGSEWMTLPKCKTSCFENERWEDCMNVYSAVALVVRNRRPSSHLRVALDLYFPASPWRAYIGLVPRQRTRGFLQDWRIPPELEYSWFQSFQWFDGSNLPKKHINWLWRTGQLSSSQSCYGVHMNIVYSHNVVQNRKTITHSARGLAKPPPALET